jgi:DNA-binding protein
MTQKPIVKARGHHGARSLDITLPVAIVKNYEIKEGDVFSIEVESEKGELKIVYTRIFRQR